MNIIDFNIKLSRETLWKRKSVQVHTTTPKGILSSFQVTVP